MARERHELEITERPIGDVIVLQLKGRLVVSDGDEVFRDTLNRLIQAGHRKLLLNLDEVTYIDSAGLGVMVSKYVSLYRRGGRLKLCNVRVRSFHVLSITRLLTVFESYDSEAAAIASFAG